MSIGAGAGRALAIALLTLACSSAPASIPDGALPATAERLARDVFVEPLAPGIWRHVSYRSFPGVGSFPSNGLILRTGSGSLIVDTAWNPTQTAAILDWTELHVGPTEGLFVTHAHDDRLGGLAETRRRGVRAWALEATVRLAAERGWPEIEIAVESGFRLASFGLDGEVFFPGPGHTPDNAVVWLAAPRLLVGGCLVRSLERQTLGNTSEAALTEWDTSIAALEQRYRDARIVLPGHGEPGDRALLAHTRRLLAEPR